MEDWSGEVRARLARAGRGARALALRLRRRLPGRLRRAGPWALAALAVAGGLALAVSALTAYTAVELTRFQRAEARRAVLVYAAGQALAPRTSVRAVDLSGTLARLKYVETRAAPVAPGQYRRTGAAWEIFARRTGESNAPARLRLELDGERIRRLSVDGHPVDAATFEPEVLASAADRRGEDYRPVRLADVPFTLLNAVLAIEDHRFFDHGGVDLRGLIRAAWINFQAGRVAQGGSTITQQLVKNRLLGARRTYGRKLREAWLAAAVEWRYGKPQILEAYLNEMYLGQRGPFALRGVAAAARAYFAKEVHQLTLAESALLAGMARAPNSYSPVLNPDRARQRRDVVLARMLELGQISDADYQAARREPIRLQPAPAAGQMAPYFADVVRQEVEQRFGDDLIGGDRASRVFTTLDLPLQRFAEEAVGRGLERLERRWTRVRRGDPGERLQAALVALDPATGAIRALVGGRDYTRSQFNRAVLARRQPGSAFKPFVYLAALRARRGGAAFTAASFVEDSPLTLDVNGEPWSPRNYEDRYEGRVSVRRALERSLNAATVRVAVEIGLPAVVETARALGITSPLQPVPAMALGAFEVTPLELARAYVPLAAAGRRPAALTALRAVDEGDGPSPLDVETQSVVSPSEAYLMTSLLQGVMTAGTAAGIPVAGPVAGKTGTTNDGRDAWFVGYTPELVALVWVGFDTGEAHGLSAADAALPIWAEFMKQALAAYPPSGFTVPPGVVTLQIDTTNGKVANRFCPVTARETFLAGTEPAGCDEHGWFGEQVVDWWRRLRDLLGR